MSSRGISYCLSLIARQIDCRSVLKLSGLSAKLFFSGTEPSADKCDINEDLLVMRNKFVAFSSDV